MLNSANRRPLPNYEAWCEFTLGQCGITLTKSYCLERIKELEDLRAPATRSFIQSYGDDYRVEVISWFERAASEGS